MSSKKEKQISPLGASNGVVHEAPSEKAHQVIYSKAYLYLCLKSNDYLEF